MRAMSKFLALALTSALQAAVAAPVTLDFEGKTTLAAKSWAAADVQYENVGVTFAGFGGFVDSGLSPCNGTWQTIAPRNNASCGYLLLGSRPDLAKSETKELIINIAGGFDSELSFFFAMQNYSGVSVIVYEETGGQGAAVGAADLGTNVCNDGSTALCNWQRAAITFSGTAKSIVVKGTDNYIALDNLSFNSTSATGNTPLPEPGSIALAFGALAGAGFARRRAAR